MLGRKGFETKLFYKVSLMEMVPGDDFYRQVSKVLDLGFVYERCKNLYGSTGNPSIDPGVFYRMCLYGYFEGITHDRDLVRKVSDSLSARLFVGYDLDEEIPWHSTISRTRAKLSGEIFEELFRRVLSMCVNAGLVSGGHQSIDSTLVKANACLDSTVRKEPSLTVSEYIGRTLSENEEEGTDKQEELKGADEGKGGQNGPVKLIETGGYPRNNISRYSNRDYYSPADPDSRIAFKKQNKTDLYYAEQISVDSYCNVITAVVATHADYTDSEALVGIAGRTRDNLEENGLELNSLGADSNYYSEKNLKELTDKKVTAYIPTRSAKNCHGGISKDRFIYDERSDRYVCPAGESLSIYCRREDEITYKADIKTCKECRLREECKPGKRGRSIRHSLYYGYVASLKQRQRSFAYKEAMRIRKTTTEPVFADAKNNHGLRRLNVRGLDKAQKVFTLIAVVQNLKKLLRHTLKKKHASEKYIQTRYMLTNLSREPYGALFTFSRPSIL